MSFSTKPPSLLRRLGMYALVTAMLLSLTGCLTFETLIKLKRDGSGTIEQTFIFTSEMIRMALLFGGDDGGPVELCDEEDLAEEAASMGEGVRLVSSEAINNDEALGCRAVFAFDDINTLRVEFNPENQMPAGLTDAPPDDETPDEEVGEEDFVTFNFDPGNPSTLVVTMNQDFEPEQNEQEEEQTDDDPFAADSTQRAQQMQMMREMFKGARLAVILEVDGSITETTASFYEDNRVTLMDINFDKLLEDEEYLQTIADANPQSPDEMKALMADVEGIMVETNEEFTVRFE